MNLNEIPVGKRTEKICDLGFLYIVTAQYSSNIVNYPQRCLPIIHPLTYIINSSHSVNFPLH